MLGMTDRRPALPHRTTAELAGGLDHLRAAPTEQGTVRLVVRRPDLGAREILDEGVLDVAVGSGMNLNIFADQPGDLEDKIVDLTLIPGAGEYVYDTVVQTKTTGKIADDGRSHRLCSRNDILQHPVHHVLLKDSDITVGQQIHFVGFEFQATLVRYVSQKDLAEIRQPHPLPPPEVESAA